MWHHRGPKGAGAGEITLGERSGMGDTREVLEQMGVLGLAKSGVLMQNPIWKLLYSPTIH
jgi:hypothetical protein